jgi:hypothetical protein
MIGGVADNFLYDCIERVESQQLFQLLLKDIKSVSDRFF